MFSKHRPKPLKIIDIRVRNFVRTTLHLPHDLPKAAFHARVVDGRLGIPCLRYLLPMLANSRLIYRKPNGTLLRVRTKRLTSTNQLNSFYRGELYSKCDGANLKESTKCPQASSWVSDFSGFLSGREYIVSLQVRYGTLFNRARGARGGENKDRSCRRDFGSIETLNHILQ